MKNEKSSIMPLIFRLIVIFILLIISAFLFEIAPYYKLKETFEDGVTRLVVDSKDVTNSSPHYAYVDNGVIMMSADTVMKYFDVFVYYDQKYDTVIITNDVTVAKIKLGENQIDINGEVKALEGIATMKEIENESNTESGENEVLYIPVSSLQDIVRANIEFNDKIIVTTIDGGNRICLATADDKTKLRLYKRIFTKTMGIVNPGETIYLFDINDSGDSDYYVARNIRGDIGYVAKKDINSLKLSNYENKYQKEQKKLSDEKITLVWEYAQYGTPNRQGESKINAIDIISPTWLYVDQEKLTLKTTTNMEYKNWAEKQGYRVWPTLKNEDSTRNCNIGLDNTSKLVTDMKLREKFINEVTNYAVDHKFEGINIDFEYMYKKDVNEFSEFVRELAATLRRNNIIVSIDVIIPEGSDNYSLCFDRRALSKSVDYMMLMAYDQYGTFDRGTTKQGPTASLEWVEVNITKMLKNIDVPKEKLILCVPLYYMSWLVDGETNISKNDSRTIPMSNANAVLQKYKDVAVWNETDGQYYVETKEGNNIRKIWVENEESLKLKVDLVNKYDLAGIACWRWGYENDKVWSTIDNTLKR